jgi:hypothetical protein
LRFEDEEILNSALEALIEISSTNYSLMGNYLDETLSATSRFLQNKDHHEVAAFAIEVWTSLLEAEAANERDTN